jgi:hypothetical protein
MILFRDLTTSEAKLHLHSGQCATRMTGNSKGLILLSSYTLVLKFLKELLDILITGTE